MVLDYSILINLLLAFVFGGIIGYLREVEGKTAGLRTHILVCMGSTLFMQVSANMLTLSSIADPGRIAAGVVTGIGFLGAGTILRGGQGVKGLTTAASIWITAAIGLALGVNLYFGAFMTTIITAFTLQVLGYMEKSFIKGNK
ncbi:MAG: MgtC/SapB family protein [Candidatus Margulisbacteria bacterium]|nr:MgtC/SapB family protein [Candidatus Margulisiibacteriota bacterium]MBU1021933.1 MgtC/SapB family protein [Candidatus Margulisiibacteriota bacterium]MBU1728912.1 MgtC/SapB family protein [Candidatus Margulisiibacteriota bacterium]MBU1954718.1 MgtC/SapB family protein [Candidatus Margulisiibacteriota bacterium]